MLLSLFLAAEGNRNDDEDCLGLVLLTATLCLMVAIIHNANRIKKYYPLYSH